MARWQDANRLPSCPGLDKPPIPGATRACWPP